MRSKGKASKSALLFYCFAAALLFFSSAALSSAAGVIDLPQTGQTTCYDSDGIEISCANTEQDGDWQAGVPWPNPRFVSGTGAEADCMIDKLTGLMWPKNGNLAGGTKTWQDALTYSNNLTLCGHSDWRLPNVIELRSLVNTGEPDTTAWLNTQGFNSVQSYDYWSSSTSADYPDYAWIVYMWNGYVGNDSKDVDFYVLPVRAGQSGSFGSSAVDLPRTGQTTCYDSGGGVIPCANTGQDGELLMGATWPNPRFVSGTGAEADCMIDKLTGLMWPKNGNLAGGKKTWQDALTYSNNLTLCGYSDWRLPNVIELRSLVNDEKSNTAAWLNTQGFNSVRSYLYWSSSSYAYYPGFAWGVNMWYGFVSYDYKYDSYYVLPVRAGQFGNSDISVLLSDNPDPADLGQQVTYTATIKNNGPTKATTVTLTDTLPTGFSYVSATATQGTCSNALGKITCTIGDMAVNASVTVTIKVTAGAVGVSNTVTVSSASMDNKPANNTATVTTQVYGMLLDLAPTTLTTAAATAQNLTAYYTHTKGVATLKTLEFLISLNGGVAYGIHLKYDKATNIISIFGNTGTTVTDTCTPGQAKILSNSQGALNCALTTIALTPTALSINWNITPSALFASSTPRKVSLKATDTAAKVIGWSILGDWKITSSNAAPTLGTLTPNASFGTPKLFTAIYSDADGFANLKQVDLLVSTDGTSTNAIRARYDRSNDALTLFNDAGTGMVSGSCVPGGAGSLSNTQGTLNCAQTTVTGTGNNLTVQWHITAKSGFATTTAKQLKMAAWDYSGLTTNLIQKGTWTINTAPTLGTVTPAAVTTNSGTPKAFTAIYSDANGNPNLKTLEFLVSTDGGTANAIYLIYDKTANKLQMYNDAGTALLAASCTPGVAGSLTNAQGTLNCAQTTVTPSGNDITVKWTINPKTAFASTGNAKQIKTKATDIFGATTGLIQKGTWTINTKPAIVSLNPAILTSQQSESKTLTAVYTDGDGYANLKNVEILISPTGTVANGIRARYTPSTDKLSIFNDLGTVILQSCTKGTAGTISNANGAIDCNLTTVTTNADNMTVAWNITPASSFASATARQVKLQATDNANALTGWVKKGDWTISSGPSLSRLTPTPITTLQGTPQTFTAVYSDPDGFANLSTMEFLVSPDGTKTNAIYLIYDRATDKLSMYDNAGTAPLATTCTPAAAGASITNNQGTLNCTKTTVTKTGNDITINWAINPKPAFASTTPKQVLMSATDATALTTGLVKKGDWTIIPTNTAPTLGTLTPAAATSKAGAAQQFSATCSDANGFANIKTMELMISPSGIDSANSVWAIYNRTENLLHLRNDANTANIVASCSPGEAKTIGNTRGNLNCANVTINQTGNDLTVNWSVTPKAIFTGTKTLWLNCTDNSAADAGMANKGSWTINP